MPMPEVPRKSGVKRQRGGDEYSMTRFGIGGSHKAVDPTRRRTTGVSRETGRSAAGRRRSNVRDLIFLSVLIVMLDRTIYCIALQRDLSRVASHRPSKASPETNENSRVWNSEVSSSERGLSDRLIRILPSRWFRDANQKSWEIIESVRGGARTTSLDTAASSSAHICPETNATLTATQTPNGADRFLGNVVGMVGYVVAWQSLLTLMSNGGDLLFEEIATRFMSEESAGALKMVRQIVSRFGDHGVVDVLREYPSKDVVVATKALSRLQRASAYYAEHYTHVTKTVDDSELLEKLAHYAVFAKAAYGWKMHLALSGRLHLGDLKALLRQTGVREVDVVETHWKARTHRPAYFLVRDEKHGKLVLSIRGTWSARDVLTDLCCTGDDFATATGIHNAHHGMLEGARGVAKMTEGTIAAELATRPDYTLVLVGHSLGGGVAAVLGTLWEHRFPGVSVYAYGCPCVGPLGKRPTMNDSIVSVVGEGDPFSCLSLGHLADVSSGIARLCENEELRSNSLERTEAPVEVMAHDDLVWCFETMRDLRSDVNGAKMYPPGRIFYISRSSLKKLEEDDSLDLREVPQEFFQDLKLHSRMLDVSKHVPTLYETYLQRLWSEMSTERATSVLGKQ